MNIFAPKSITDNDIFSFSEIIYMSHFFKQNHYRVHAKLLSTEEVNKIQNKSEDTILIIQFMDDSIIEWLDTCKMNLTGRVILYGLGAQTYCTALNERYKFDLIVSSYSYTAIKEWIETKLINTHCASTEEFDEADYSIMGLSRIPIVPILSSRGCKNACNFCAIACTNSYSKKYISRSAESIYSEVSNYVNMYDKRRFYFVDSCFVSGELDSKKRAIEFSKLILKSELKIKFSIETRADYIDYDTFSILKEAGLAKVLIGVENFNDNVLKRYNKGITRQKILEGIGILEQLHIPMNLSMILFDPLTSRKELADNLECILKYDLLDYFEIHNIFRKLILIPGNRLNLRDALKYGQNIKGDEWIRRTSEYQIYNPFVNTIWEIIEENNGCFEEYNKRAIRAYNSIAEKKGFLKNQKRNFIINLLDVINEAENTIEKKSLREMIYKDLLEK